MQKTNKPLYKQVEHHNINRELNNINRELKNINRELKNETPKKLDNAHIRIAITGGIGTGKSFVCRHLEEMGFPVFYCDDEAKQIIRNDDAVKNALQKVVGKTLYDENGRLVKRVLADFICASAEHAAKINAIVHPRVRQKFEEWAASQHSLYIYMECALLFEAHFDDLVDYTVTVAVAEHIRLQRLMERDHISEEKAQEWIQLQIPEREKQERADFVIKNDGGEDIAEQIQDIHRKIQNIHR